MTMRVGRLADNNTEPERGNAMARKTKVRTTLNPGTVIKVEEAELIDLSRQGLIYSRELADGETIPKGEKAFVDDEPVETESGTLDAPSVPDKKGAVK